MHDWVDEEKDSIRWRSLWEVISDGKFRKGRHPVPEYRLPDG